MRTNGADVYEPSLAECEALAKKFHPDFRWSQLHEHEKQGLIDEWREEQVKKAPPHLSSSEPSQVPRAGAVSEADFLRVVDTLGKLIALQPTATKAATKASARLVVRTLGRALRPIIEREQQQRAELQRDLSQMRREWAEQSRRHNDLFSGLLKELCMHKRDENEGRANRLDELEGRVDEAIAELARR